MMKRFNQIPHRMAHRLQVRGLLVGHAPHLEAPPWRMRVRNIGGMVYDIIPKLRVTTSSNSSTRASDRAATRCHTAGSEPDPMCVWMRTTRSWYLLTISYEWNQRTSSIFKTHFNCADKLMPNAEGCGGPPLGEVGWEEGREEYNTGGDKPAGTDLIHKHAIVYYTAYHIGLSGSTTTLSRVETYTTFMAWKHFAKSLKLWQRAGVKRDTHRVDVVKVIRKLLRWQANLFRRNSTSNCSENFISTRSIKT